MNLTARQLEIIEASGRILTRQGITGLTVKNLAIEMGFAESALYRHFKSKEDILILMIQYLHHNIVERLEPIRLSEQSPLDKIKTIFESQFHFLQYNKHFVIAMMSEGLIDESEDIKAEAMKIITYKLPLVYQLLEKSINTGLIKPKVPTETLLHFLIGGFRILLLKWKIMSFRFDITTEGNQLLKDFFIMIDHHET